MKLLAIVLSLLLIGCVGPKVTKRASVVQTQTGFDLYSAKDVFEMSADIGGSKVKYSSKTAGVIESIVKGAASISGSIGQGLVTKSILDDN